MKKWKRHILPLLLGGWLSYGFGFMAVDVYFPAIYSCQPHEQSLFCHNGQGAHLVAETEIKAKKAAMAALLVYLIGYGIVLKL